MDDETVFALALLQVPGVGPRRFQSLLARFGSAKATYYAGKAELSCFNNPAYKDLADRIVDCRKDPGVTLRIERLLGKYSAQGIEVVAVTDQEYPAALKLIPDPPPVLWRKGVLRPESTRVAIVGTRRATPYGRKVAREIARSLSLAGAEVVSGLARGIDTAAHEGTVACGRPTIAVLGCGVDQVFNQDASLLANDIISAGGALVSEYVPGTPPLAEHFPVRNRIISGLSCGVIVVEAPEKSGALITAHAGADQGREVMVVPGSIYSPASVGCHRLIGDGAKIVTSVEDVLRVLGFTAGAAGRPAYRQDCLPVEVTGAEASVFAVLKHGPARFEGIVDECSLDAVDVGVALGMLEIRGLARRTAEGWFESAFGG